VNCVLKINCFEDNEVKRNGVGKKMKSCAIVLVFLSFIFQQIRRISGGNGEPFGEKGQKNYENEEEGKIIPHRLKLDIVLKAEKEKTKWILILVKNFGGKI